MLNLAVRAPLAVALGAIGGALCRYYIGRWITLHSFVGGASAFPIGTFVVNVSGCLLMGIAAALGNRLDLSSDARLLMTTGGLGAYTTFSTYSLETVDLLERGRWEMAGAYWMGSAASGLAALRLGMVLGAWR
ncbi:MAG: fluoride efflux transporter CrcB [Elainellaceae cyanobacterium]